MRFYYFLLGLLGAATADTAPPQSAAPPDALAGNIYTPTLNARTASIEQAPASGAPSPSLSKLPDVPPPAKVPTLTEPETGHEYGSVNLVNNCDQALYVRSVGAWYLGGPRNGSNEGWGTPEDDFVIEIPAHKMYKEPYRATCYAPNGGGASYCPAADKLGGQGVSMKISTDRDVTKNIITQFEYALMQNLDRTDDTFKRLIYDMSLVDCGNPGVPADDFNGTEVMHEKKVKECPGYNGGVSITFANDTEAVNCPPVYCDGVNRCLLVYMWDRSRKMEATWQCLNEYRGDMRVEFCVNKGDSAKAIKAIYNKYASTATHEILDLQKTVPNFVSAATPSPPPARRRPRRVAARSLPGFPWSLPQPQSQFKNSSEIDTTLRTSYTPLSAGVPSSSLHVATRTAANPESFTSTLAINPNGKGQALDSEPTHRPEDEVLKADKRSLERELEGETYSVVTAIVTVTKTVYHT
ncbi:hypothetical protein P280DRAFT_554506 [Massarina eburnea CBS 473.64]|uniref:Uncharacterized protein n=1 Tax=Massarina eburnea CBS 473.64 TaxID=1395130 RepID=A0A6A6RGE9_9PLEO|nr:hypothetical protein P280DRAFT_554506 [Massarina eburnea CBS 473.64]